MAATKYSTNKLVIDSLKAMHAFSSPRALLVCLSILTAVDCCTALLFWRNINYFLLLAYVLVGVSAYFIRHSTDVELGAGSRRLRLLEQFHYDSRSGTLFSAYECVTV
jgi:hypothetical protein